MSKDQKQILVTGAASGIGLSITEHLAEKGDHVFAADINQETLKKFQNSENITPIFLDVTKTQSIHEAAETIEKVTSGLDGLVNNAGLFVGGPLVEIPENKVEAIFAVNVLGVYKVTKGFYPLLFKNKGRVVNIGSEAGRIAFPMNGPYAMSKYALEAFSDSLRRELMFHKMKVIHLQIGAINTPLIDETFNAYTEQIDLENTHYKNLLKIVVSTCEKEKSSCADPIVVAKAVYKAFHKKRPKARKRLKNNKGRRMLEFLPSSLLDFLMRKTLK